MGHMWRSPGLVSGLFPPATRMGRTFGRMSARRRRGAPVGVAAARIGSARSGVVSGIIRPEQGPRLEPAPPRASPPVAYARSSVEART